MSDAIDEIRRRWAPIKYTGLFVCPEHDNEIVVGRHDPEDQWADLGIIVFVAEAASKPDVAAFAKAPDDVRFLLGQLLDLEARIRALVGVAKAADPMTPVEQRAAAERQLPTIRQVVEQWIADRGLLPAPSHVEDLIARLLTREREARRLGREALHKYGRHPEACGYWSFDDSGRSLACDCGLDRARAKEEGDE